MGILENQHELVIPDAVSESSYATNSTYVKLRPPKSGTLKPRIKCRDGGKRGNIRANNASELERLCGEVNEDESGFLELESSESPFTKVLEDPDLYKTWQVFMSLSGSAQDRFIGHLNKVTKRKTTTSFGGRIRKENSIGEEFVVIEENEGDVVEVEECERIREARERYLLIQKRVRHSMKKQGLHKVPFDVLESYEQEITKYFTDSTNVDNSIPLVIKEIDKYNRSWLYRLCDYHGLKAESAEEGDVVISCTKLKFTSPSIFFSEFLKMIL